MKHCWRCDVTHQEMRCSVCGSVLLAPNERRVLLALAMGLSNDEIGAHLGVTTQAAKNVVYRLFKKMGCSSRLEAVVMHHGVQERRIA